MYTLVVPVRLPSDQGLFEDQRFEVPAIREGLRLSTVAVDLEDAPLLLRIDGLPSAPASFDLLEDLRLALRCAALDLGHGVQPVAAQASVAELTRYDGSAPAVFATASGALPIVSSVFSKKSEHLSRLAVSLERRLGADGLARLRADARLSTAVRLNAEADFAGGLAARMVVLMSALEVLVDRAGRKGKRGAAVAMARNAFGGGEDGKLAARELDRLYEARNALLHEGADVTAAQVHTLAGIVRQVLKERLPGS